MVGFGLPTTAPNPSLPILRHPGMPKIYQSKRDRCFFKYFNSAADGWRNKYIPIEIRNESEALEWKANYLTLHPNQPPAKRRGTDPEKDRINTAKYIWRAHYSDGCLFETFLELSQQECHYCGSKPANQSKGFIYNGLDRIDSDLDHSPSNIVPCCKHCNFAKRDLPYDAFLDLIMKIHKNLCQ